MPVVTRRNAARSTFACLCAVSLLAFMGEVGRAAPGPSSVLPDRPDAQTPTPQEAQQLGRDFESTAAGIAFRAPAGMKEIKSVGEDVIVRYVDDKRKWVLIVTKLQFDRAVPLATPATNPARNSENVPRGLLDLTAEQLKTNAPGTEILRQDTTTLGGNDVGMLAAKFNIGTETDLTQQALFRVSDKRYYQFNFTTPAPRIDKIEEDPGVKTAVDTFSAVLDSVKLLEQTAVHDEQVQRLFRTRTLFVNLTEEKVRKALVKEQWQRILLNGKDVGYSYIVEETGHDLPREGHKESQFAGGDDGVVIGVRTRVMPEAGVRKDVLTWMWMSFDRKHEKWSNTAITDKGKDASGKPLREEFGDIGSTDVRETTVFDKNLLPGQQIAPGKVDAKQPAFRRAELYTLHVEHIGKNQTSEPVVRDLPVFYMPQALAHLLPRLVPRRMPVSYMFASYISDNSQVMSRYVDVGARDEYKLGNSVIDAVPVRDRIGLEGSVTTTYISPTGEFLGTINPDSNVTILPSDAQTLQKMWTDIDLSRPNSVSERAK